MHVCVCVCACVVDVQVSVFPSLAPVCKCDVNAEHFSIIHQVSQPLIFPFCFAFHVAYRPGDNALGCMGPFTTWRQVQWVAGHASLHEVLALPKNFL